MNSKNRIAVGFSFFWAAFSVVSAQAKECEVQFDSAQAKIGFTAFKTTEKLPVNGRFLKAQWEGISKGKWKAVLGSTHVIFDGKSVETDNPARNKTLVDGFFSQWASSARVDVRVEKIEGTEEKGTFQAKLGVNGQKLNLPFEYSFLGGEFIAKSALDILKDLKAKKAFEILHGLCATLHQGKDGVSKTWSEVALEVRAPAVLSCH